METTTTTNNTSAVLDVVTENKEIPSLYSNINNNNKDQQHDHRSSIYSNSTTSIVDNNSLVHSPSLESFSTIQDIENLSELNIDDENIADLCVKIDNPQKHLETLETYITFRITTRVARIEFNDNEYVVRRRYNDFIWLRQKLNECHPFCIVPPLPGKHTLIGQLDRYSKDFILVRMKALNVFIARIVEHPILSCNEHFKMFLTIKQPEFTLHRRQRTNPPETRVRTLSHSNSTDTVLKNRHMEFDRMRLYLGNLSAKLQSIERISGRIAKERSDFISELNNYHPIFTTWATTEEPQLAFILQRIGNAVERNAAAQNMLVRSYGSTVAYPLKDFVAYVDVVQETMRKREAYQGAYEASMDELSKRHDEKDKLMAGVSSSQLPASSSTGGFSLWKLPSCDEKLEKLGVCIPQLLKKVESNQDNLECANESLRSDLDRWQNEKQQYLKKVLLNFVNKQIEYYQLSVNAWENVVTNEPQQNITNNCNTSSSTTK